MEISIVFKPPRLGIYTFLCSVCYKGIIIKRLCISYEHILCFSLFFPYTHTHNVIHTYIHIFICHIYEKICQYFHLLLFTIYSHVYIFRASLVAQMVMQEDPGSIPGFGRSPGEGHGNPLQYTCLENSMDRGAWRATVHGFTKSQT